VKRLPCALLVEVELASVSCLAKSLPPFFPDLHCHRWNSVDATIVAVEVREDLADVVQRWLQLVPDPGVDRELD
jgi:hypothetical protein